MILKALEIMEAPSGETLYVCDSLGDIKAAGAAGVKTFSLSTGGHSREELKTAGAWKTGDGLPEILHCFRRL
jgi:phosphoglycolate phosphatase-like HAD superfamily hydrolase